MIGKIDYRLRPAKAVQRHMIVDVCSRLVSFASLADYQYIGLGGFEFVDFDLFHRALGVTDMVSIEVNTTDLLRYEFNRPFRTIKLLGGAASDQLPSIDLDRLSIVWLDYEQHLNLEVIQDVTLLCGRLMSGSALFVTMSARPDTPRTMRRSELVARIGEERTPIGVDDDSLAKWGLANVQRRVLSDIIHTSLRDRPASAQWQQLLDVHYADGGNMQTMGGLVVVPDDQERVVSARFKDMDFVRYSGEEPVEIRVPVLTAKERRALDEQLPLEAGRQLNEPWLSGEDAEAYLNVYRYYRGERIPA